MNMETVRMCVSNQDRCDERIIVYDGKTAGNIGSIIAGYHL